MQSDIALKVRVYIIYFKNYNAKDSTNFKKNQARPQESNNIELTCKYSLKLALYLQQRNMPAHHTAENYPVFKA